MTYSRKSFSGSAAPTTLTSAASSSDTTINVASTTNFPNTANGPFVVTIDRGTTSEEKVEIASYTSTVLTVSSGGRGFDGTTAVAHSLGADLRHTLDAGTINNHESFVAGNGTVTPSTSAVGDAAADGTSAFPAAGDHKHAREAFAVGVSSASAPGDAAADGSSVSPARGDHKHSRESYATIATGIGTATATFSNKRITRRVVAVTQSATPAINTDNTDVASITGLAQAITSMTSSLTGTPVDGDMLLVRITDNGTARAITWGSSFEASGGTPLPTTTVISTMLTVGFLWNTATSKWRCIAVS